MQDIIIILYSNTVSFTKAIPCKHISTSSPVLHRLLFRRLKLEIVDSRMLFISCLQFPAAQAKLLTAASMGDSAAHTDHTRALADVFWPCVFARTLT